MRSYGLTNRLKTKIPLVNRNSRSFFEIFENEREVF